MMRPAALPEADSTPVDSVDERFDDSPSGQFARTVMTAVAQLEKDLIRQRTMAGRARKVREGKYMASITPYGYQRKDGRLVEDPAEADVVRRMFRWAKEGIGLRGIAARLTQEGVPPPNPERTRWGWHITTVYKILTARRYTGRTTYGGEPMSCPAIVDEVTFEAAQEALRRRRRDSPRNTKRFYLLQHLVWCGHCGGRYMAKTVSRTKAVYLCRQRTVYGKAAGHQGIKWRWHAEELEGVVKAHVMALLTDEDYLRREAQLYVERSESDVREWEDKHNRLNGRLAGLEQEEARVLTLARRGLIDEAQTARQLAEVRAEQQQAEEALKEHDDQRPNDLLLGHFRGIAESGTSFFADEVFPELRLDEVEDTEGGRVVAYELESETTWREFIEKLVSRICVEDDGRVTIEGPLPFPGFWDTEKNMMVSANPRSR
jgi:site-specific DNA recombinase